MYTLNRSASRAGVIGLNFDLGLDFDQAQRSGADHCFGPVVGVQLPQDVIDVACLAWLMLSPGTNLLDYYLGFDSAGFLLAVLLSALGPLLLAVLTGLAYDGKRARQGQ